jgi:hypothetical protein
MPEPASVLTRLGNEFKFQVGSGSPPTFANFCAVTDAGAIGETKPQIDVTSLCDSARTYRGGLADGASITLKCNFLQGDAAIRAMYVAYQNNEVQTFRLALDDTSPEEYFQFEAAITAWNLAVPVGNKSEVVFTLKISGVVTWHYT